MTLSEQERQALIKQNEQLNKLLERMLIDSGLAPMFMKRQAAYRYYANKGSKDRYFHTVRKVKHNGKLRYVSGIYKYIKSKNHLKLTQPKYHAKKRDAMKRAYDLHIKAEGK